MEKQMGVYRVKTIRVSLAVSEPGKKVSEPVHAQGILKAVYDGLDADQEHFTVLALDKGNRVRGYKVVHSGGQSEASIDLRCVFRYALMMGATGIIIAHNHPSGRTDASREDIELTRKMINAGDMLGIAVVDHIIIVGTYNNAFSSMRECGMM